MCEQHNLEGRAVSRSLTAAKRAGLRYVSDHDPGIRRAPRGKGFRYLAPSGRRIQEEGALARIRSLAIPPAWTDVWICRHGLGHIQATGRDARGRKQYIYHPKWSEVRDTAKYDRLIGFGKHLKKLRRQIDRDLRRRGFPKEKIVATVVRLLQTTFIRVGNEEYARKNHSFGLTTLRSKHVRIKNEHVHFEFRGKSGVKHAVDLNDRRIARIVKRCQDLPGEELFQYLDENGKRRRVKSDDVNDYMRSATGQEFTAKDFRTWGGTVLAATALDEFRAFDSLAAAKRNIVKAIETVAKRLGNTKTVCRKCYVHPIVLDAYLDGTLRTQLRTRVESELKQQLHRLSPEEAAVLAFLQQHFKKHV
jgi:DNA topoisomerase-1